MSHITHVHDLSTLVLRCSFRKFTYGSARYKNFWTLLMISGLDMKPRCHPHKSRKMRLGKAAWADIARAKC